MSLPGIDVTSGLERLGGSHKLYRSLLQGFHRDYHTAVERLRVLLAGRRQDAVTAAVGLSHAIKGVAGNLGAREVHEAARELERGIKQENREQWPDLLDRLEQALAVVLASIALMTREERAPEAEAWEMRPDRPINRETVAPLLEELFSLLEMNDVQAEACLESLADLLKGTVMQQELTLLAEQISAFDFDAAMITLSAMAKSMNLPLGRRA